MASQSKRLKSYFKVFETINQTLNIIGCISLGRQSYCNAAAKYYTMKIEAIKTDKAGYKLIAASKVIDFKGCKPQVSPCVFFDWNPTGKSLRRFYGNNYESMPFKSFKDAIKYIFSI